MAKDQADGAEIGDNSEVDVDHEELDRFIKELEGKQKTITEATGSLRNRIKEIIGQTGWHKGALAAIRKIAAMSPTARADYLRTFQPMFDAMLAHAWESEMRDLIDQLQDEGAD